jgi:hypothetical protein
MENCLQCNGLLREGGRMVSSGLLRGAGGSAGCCGLSQLPQDDVLTFAWTTNTAFCHNFN